MIEWKPTGNGPVEDCDDWTARVDGFVLRVEQMDVNSWWYCVYCPEGIVDPEGQAAKTTAAEAKAAAVSLYEGLC